MAIRFAAGTITHQQARELNKMAAMLERMSNSFMGGGGTSLIKCDGKITSVNGGSITGVTNANPAEITSTAHGMIDGETVTISGVTGSTGVNGTFIITSTGTDTFTVPIDAGGAYVAGGIWSGRRYSWTEQQYNPANGLYVDKINGRIGIPTDMYAYERNLALIADFPFFAEMTQRCRVDATVVWEFDESGSVAGNDNPDECTRAVMKVCPTRGVIAFVKDGDNITDITIDTGSGAATLEGLDVVTSITVQTRDCSTGEITCEDNQTDCCPGVVTQCCENAVPDKLFLTFANSGLCASLDGLTFELNYCGDCCSEFDQWVSSPDSPIGGCMGDNFTGPLGFLFDCAASNPFFNLKTGAFVLGGPPCEDPGHSANVDPVSLTCDPFEVTGTMVVNPDFPSTYPPGCCEAVSIAFTVTG